MADERPVGGRTSAPDPGIHDDDELADALAAELDHLAATGAVPVIRMPMPRPDPTPEPASAPPAPRSASASQPAAPQPASASQPAAPRPEPVAPPQPEAAPPQPAAARPRPAPSPPSESPVVSRPESTVPAARHAGSPTATVPEASPQPHAAHRAAARRGHENATAAAPRAQAVAPAPVPAPAPPAEVSSPRTGAHVAPDPLDATGPLPIPPPLYEAWEQSLRQIGRRDWEDEDGDEFDAGAAWPVEDDDAPTATISRADLGQLPPDLLAIPVRSVPVPAAPVQPTPPQDVPAGQGRQRRRERAGAAAEAAPPAVAVDVLPEEAPPGDPASADAVPTAVDEDDGLDEVATDIPSVHASDTAAIALPPLLETPAVSTGVVPVPAAAGGAGMGPLLQALLWIGAFATPLALLIGFAVAAAGAGPGGGIAVVLGAALGLPAAARLGAAAAGERTGTAGVTARVLGQAGVAAAVLLIAARLVAAVLALLAVADVAMAFAARTGVGGDVGTAGVVAVLLVGLLALAAAAAPSRLGTGLLLTLGGAGLIGTLVVLTVFASAGTGAPGAGSAQGVVTAGAAGFAFVALLLAATAPDLIPEASGRGPARAPTVALAVGGVVGALLLAAAVSIAARTGGAGDPGTALVGALADATSAAATGPVAAIMLLASLTLPALLFRSAGAAAAALLPGRSAWLGAAAGGLLALALALAALAAGIGLVGAFAAVGPLVGIPVAVWVGVATAAPSRALGAHSRSTTAAAATIAVLIGWLLTDGFGTPGARSVLLDATGVPFSSAWRGSPAFGVAAAFVLGAVAALVGRLSARRDASPAPSRMRSEQPQPVDSVGE